MKKAKFALTAVAVFAVIGGALAFKASRNFDLTVYTNSVVGTVSQCTVQTTIENATASGAGDTFKTVASLAPTTLPCPEIVLRTNL